MSLSERSGLGAVQKATLLGQLGQLFLTDREGAGLRGTSIFIISLEEEGGSPQPLPSAVHTLALGPSSQQEKTCRF